MPAPLNINPPLCEPPDVTQSTLIALPQLIIMQSFLKILLAVMICAHLSDPSLDGFLYAEVTDKIDLLDLNSLMLDKCLFIFDNIFL